MESRTFVTDDAFTPTADLVDPSVPDLSLRRGDYSVSFAMNSQRRRDSEADDLPDITPELMKKLDTMWDDDAHDQPVQCLVIALRGHMDSINPYMETLRDSNRAWYECWKFLYQIAQQLDLALQNESGKKYYSIPEKLKLEEMRARLDLGKTETDWAAAKERHFDKLDQIQREIRDLEAKLKSVKEADDLVTLTKYELNPGDFVKPTLTSRKPGCFSAFSTLFARKPRRPVVKTEEKQDPAEVQSVRDRLIREYEDQIRAKTNLYNVAGENIPAKPEKYRDAWNMAKAKMLHVKIDYYRCQSKEVMLHCLRLYILAFRTFYLIYGENPLVDTEQPIPVTMAVSVLKDGSDNPVLKAKALFRQMVRGLKCQFGKYYCLQPDRHEFTRYLDHYNSIHQAEMRDAILAGVADEKMLEKVFREYEAPEEAFALPQHEVRRRA